MKNFSVWGRVYFFLRAALNVPYADLKSDVHLSLPLKLRMWCKGFLSEKYYCYGLAQNDPKHYVSDRQRAITRFINEPYTEILNNKVIFERIVSRYVKVPENYGIITDGKCYLPLDGDAEILPVSGLLNKIEELLELHHKIVIKPVMGSFGRGVYIIEDAPGEGYRVNNTIYSIESFQELLGNLKLSLVTEFVRQGEHPGKLYPGSTNTLRIITILPSNSGRPFIAAAARRVGTNKSSPMDNNAKGGMTVNVDLDNGQLGPAAQLTRQGIVWHDCHPDSGSIIKGVITPGWANIKNEVIRLASKLPYLKYIGWDIVETDGGLVFIEGNNHPNVRVNQIHRPLLADPRVVDFYKRQSII